MEIILGCIALILDARLWTDTDIIISHRETLRCDSSTCAQGVSLAGFKLTKRPFKLA